MFGGGGIWSSLKYNPASAILSRVAIARNNARLRENRRRGFDRGLDRGFDRGLERGLERGLDRGLDLRGILKCRIEKKLHVSHTVRSCEAPACAWLFLCGSPP